MAMLNRRNFLSVLCATLVAPDPDKLLWKPGARLVSVPSGKKLIAAPAWYLYFGAQKNPSFLESYLGFGTWGLDQIPDISTSEDVRRHALSEFAKLDSRYSYCSWYAADGVSTVKGEIIRA